MVLDKMMRMQLMYDCDKCKYLITNIMRINISKLVECLNSNLNHVFNLLLTSY